MSCIFHFDESVLQSHACDKHILDAMLVENQSVDCRLRSHTWDLICKLDIMKAYAAMPMLI